MAKAQVIEPFPPDISRDDFGHWLSGFVDGEGCFYLGNPRVTNGKNSALTQPRSQFIITLRADDLPVLQLVQSFLGCGRVHVAIKRTRTNTNPVAIYYVTTSYDLADRVIPCFERYPLRAKKAADFLIWKEATLLAATVARRRLVRPFGVRGGGGPKWTTAERQLYVSLMTELKAQRAYVSCPRS